MKGYLENSSLLIRFVLHRERIVSGLWILILFVWVRIIAGQKIQNKSIK